MLKAVILSGLKWRIEGRHAIRSDLITLQMGYWSMMVAVESLESSPDVNRGLLRETGEMFSLSRFKKSGSRLHVECLKACTAPEVSLE